MSLSKEKKKGVSSVHWDAVGVSVLAIHSPREKSAQARKQTNTHKPYLSYSVVYLFDEDNDNEKNKDEGKKNS